MNRRLRYLKQGEKRNTIPLWREAFPEDGDGFLKYYYEEKARDNKILATEDDNGRILSMLHRNPYEVQAGEQVWKADYLVAVATAREHRRQGLMGTLIGQAVEDMYREETAFSFLMPSDAGIYEPFGFAAVYFQPRLQLKDEAECRLRKVRVRPAGEDAAWIGRWMNGWLGKRYQVFARRNQAYVERLVKELESEAGWMEVLASKAGREEDNLAPEAGCREFLKTLGSGGREESLWKGNVEGLRCWWGIREKEQRMLFADEAWTEPLAEGTDNGSASVIMARIVHLGTFLQGVRLGDNCGKRCRALKVRLKVEDRICRENNGVFLWHIGRGESWLFPWQEGMEADEVLDGEIGQLTGWLLGGRADGLGGGAWMEKIRTLSPVFLDEVV